MSEPKLLTPGELKEIQERASTSERNLADVLDQLALCDVPRLLAHIAAQDTEIDLLETRIASLQADLDALRTADDERRGR